MTLQIAALVGLGGFIGTMARYLCGLVIGSYWPLMGLNTIFVNVLGSFISGCLFGIGSERLGSPLMTFLTVGLMGGFTTFSAFSAETLLYFKDGKHLFAIAYVSMTVALGLIAVYAGFSVAKNV